VTQTAELQEFQERSNQSWERDIPSLGIKLQCLLNIDNDKIKENIRENLKRGHDEIWPYKEQDTEVIVCAGGPSLVSHIDEIKSINGKVIALANSAHILKENGIRYHAHVLLDAKPRNAEFILDEKTTYFIASQCDPEVFERAGKTGNKIYIWHAINNEEEFEIINEQGSPWIPVQAGSTITPRALRLLNILGYKNFHCFGFDSCYMDNKHHSYDQPDADKHKTMNFEFEGRDFKVSPWMIAQFMDFMQFVKNFGMNINLNVYGDGLISHLIKRGSEMTEKTQSTVSITEN